MVLVAFGVLAVFFVFEDDVGTVVVVDVAVGSVVVGVEVVDPAVVPLAPWACACAWRMALYIWVMSD